MALFGRKKKSTPEQVQEPVEPTLPAAPAPGPHGVRTVDAHRDYLVSLVQPLVPFGMSLLDATGMTLCEDLTADGDMPALPEAACDGYAVISVDLRGVGPGSPAQLAIREDVHKAGAAVGVHAGQPMPPGADAVIPTSQAEVNGDEITVRRGVHAGENVCEVGSDAVDGKVLARSGQQLDARLVGLLAGSGFPKVYCRPRPRVVVLALGEHHPRSAALSLVSTQRREASSYMVAAAAQSEGAHVWHETMTGYDQSTIADFIADQLIRADLMIICGGTNQGPDGVLGKAVASLGLIDFADVAMTPGGYQGYGLIGQDEVPLLMFPSDPASAYVSFEAFGRPLIRTLMGAENLEYRKTPAVLDAELPGDRAVSSFTPGVVRPEADGLHVTPLVGKAGGLGGLARADALVISPEGMQTKSAGEQVNCWLLNNS